MKTVNALLHALRTPLTRVEAAFHQRGRAFAFGLLSVSLFGWSAAQAQVVATSVTSATDLGREEVVNVTIDWSRTAAGVGDKVTTPIPPQLTVNPPNPPAGCVYTAPNMVCDVPDGAAGAAGTIIFQVKGLVIGGFNLTSTGTSAPPASFSGTVRSTGDILVGKTKISPVGNPVAGETMVFRLNPQIPSGDTVPAGAAIVVTDNLPGTATDFRLDAVAFSGRTPTCNSTVNANNTRTLTCTYNGPFTIASLNGSSITLTGMAGNNGSFLNVASIASGNTNYFDANPANNTTSVNYIVDPGTDIQALGVFPATGQIVNSTQTLTLSHKNNGPLPSPAGGLVQTIVPVTFAINALPAGCTQTPARSLTVSGTSYSGTLVSCTVGALAVGGQTNFSIPLTMPAAPEASSFPVVVVPPAGGGDANAGNNSVLLPYQIVNPFADLRASKTKTPGGPQPPGTQITNTLTIRNDASSPSAAAYGPGTPLRIVDYARPEEVDGGTISAVTAGWTCTVATGITPPAFIADNARTTRILCENPGPGSLNIGASTSVSFKSTIANVAAPIELTNQACTGSRALEAIGLGDANGPQPPDGGRTGNDCATAGNGLYATPVISGKAQVTIKKESSVDNVTFYDPVVNAPTLLGDVNTLYWRMTVNTSDIVQNPGQTTIPTLRLTDTLPGIMNVASTGAPAPGFVTPAVTVTTTPNTYGSCPNISAGNNGLTCTFKNVPAGTTITVLVPVSRSLVSGLLTNTATLTSPDAILSASVPGQLSDDAAVNVIPRNDVALTTKTITPAEPSVGQVVQFSITAQNLGPDNISLPGQFTVTDTLFTGTPTQATPAYEILSVTPSNPAVMSCAASNLGAGTVSCTNLTTINRYNTQTITIQARIKKPAGLAAAAGSTLYSGVTNTAAAALAPALCEFRVETSTAPVSTSAACNDAASTSNNSKVATFNIKVPAIDLQQSKVAVYPAGQTGFTIGDQLRYRFSIRNAGPSRAENIVMTDILTVPTGFHVTIAPGMPERINQAPTGGLYVLTPKAVSCTQAGQDANVVCQLNADPALSFLDAGQEVNFEIAMDTIGTALGPVIFGNKAYACADETNAYESSGKCSPDPASAGNNLAAVNDVVFPKADLEVVSKTTVTPSPVDISQPIEYAIVLRNNGTAATPKMRLRDTLPSGLEWLNTGTYQPSVSVNGGSSATLSAAGGLLNVVGAVPGNGTENTCFISNGVTNLTALTQHQEITCDISGNFPPGPAQTITLKLFARAKADLYDGSPNAPYLVNRLNTATVFPGKNVDGDNVSVDGNPANNEKTSTVQVVDAKVAGRTYLDLNNNGDQDGTTLITDQGIGGVTITLTGTDKYGNAVSRTTTTSAAAAGVGSARGDYLFDNLAPSDAVGYTITQTQPVAYGNGLPQPNVARPIRNGASVGVTAAGGVYAVSNTATTSVIGGVVLASAANGVQFDFPETQRPYVSGYVYVDANNDGIKDAAEIGIAGVRMTLTGCAAGPNGVLDSAAINAGPASCSGDDVVVSQTVTTDAAGYYVFPLDQPGRYSVIQQAAQPVVSGVTTLRGKTTAGSTDLVTSPAGTNDGGTRATVNATASNAGGVAGVLEEVNSTVASSHLRDIVISNSAAISPNNNFGEILPASVAGVVYTERGALNSNYGAGTDWPLPGATVVLTGVDDLGQPVNLTTTTKPDGSYSFEKLRPGVTYQVVKTNPAPSIINEVGGSFPGKDVTATVRGTRVDDNTISTIVLESGTKVSQTNFAVTNGPPPPKPVELPRFNLDKSHTGTIEVGKVTSYTLKVTNIGNASSSGVLRLADLLPNGMSLIAVNPITSTSGVISNQVVSGQTVRFDFTPSVAIPAGQSVVINLSVDVGAAAVDNFVNYAVVSGGGDPYVPEPPGPGCMDASHCSTDGGNSSKPKLKLVKSHSGNFVIGKVGVYTLTLSNGGNAPSPKSLHLSDLLPAGMTLVTERPIESTSGSVSNLVVNGQTVAFDLNLNAPIAAGQSVTVTLSVDVAAPALGNVTNFASVTDNPQTDFPPGQGCVDPDHCSKDPTVVKGPPTLTLAKTAPAAMKLGGTSEYQLTVRNTGESPTYGALHLIERLPVGLSLNGNIASSDGVISNVVMTGNAAEGFKATFDFAPARPLAESGGSVVITVPVTVGADTVVGVVTNYASVGGGGDIRDGGKPPEPGVNCADPRCANAPSVVAGSAMLTITKTVSKTEVELGDVVSYTITVANIGKLLVPLPDILDRLPAGFRLLEGSSRVNGAVLVKLQGAPGPVLTYTLDAVLPGKNVVITYRLRVGVGAMQGDGVNRANAQCPYNSNPNCSNEARAKVRVTGGVFTSDACVVGMVYVDCNGNQLKDSEELGIPGVRMYIEDGTFLISDSEGKYSYCGLSPKTHVMKVDQVTLPRGSRLVSSSNRNVGDANSLFLDLKNGELQRADFIEGSCSNTVLEQVKARRTQGEVSAPQAEKKGGATLSFEGMAVGYPQQGTTSANQRIVKPRIEAPATMGAAPQAETRSERDIPVPQLEINRGDIGAQ